MADLHYADTPEYATGHGVSADWEVVERACRMLRTAWIPAADVEETETAPVPGADLSMDKLGALADGLFERAGGGRRAGVPGGQDDLERANTDYRLVVEEIGYGLI